jgi:drug/metabolite transporter (DMT)-like permease
MLGFLLGLAASASWGISDFIGGLQTRRFSALSVLIVSQPIGLVLAYCVALAFGEEMLTADHFALGMFAGATVVLALAAFYRAMALGSISVVATIGALGVLVPVIGGIVQGESPEGLQAVGSRPSCSSPASRTPSGARRAARASASPRWRRWASAPSSWR